jgi:hypothetical protein
VAETGGPLQAPGGRDVLLAAALTNSSHTDGSSSVSAPTLYDKLSLDQDEEDEAEAVEREEERARSTRGDDGDQLDWEEGA